MSFHRINSWLISWALTTCLAHTPAIVYAQKSANQDQTQLPTVPFLRMPHLDEGTLDVPDGTGRSTVQVHFWVFSPADPSVRTVYYLPQIIQLPAGQSKFMRDAELEQGKVWYRFWVEFPPVLTKRGETTS